MSQPCDSLATTNKEAQWKHYVRPKPTDHLRNKSFLEFLICSTLPYETLINNVSLNIHTVHLDTIKVFYSPTNTQVSVLKTILKFKL